MGTTLFISYRRADASGYARALHDKLCQVFDPADVFMDVEAIAPGEDFEERIERTIASSDALLVLIGTTWLTASDGSVRRLDQPDDFVRVEIESALRQDVRIIPILLDGTPMPQPDELPPSLAPLARRNALLLTHGDFEGQVERLIRSLSGVMPRRLVLLFATCVLLAGAAVALILLVPPWRFAQGLLIALSLGAAGALGLGGRLLQRGFRSPGRVLLTVALPALLALGLIGTGTFRYQLRARQTFQMTVHIRTEQDTAVRSGSLVLHLDDITRRYAINAEGDVLLSDLPHRYRGDTLTVIPQVDGFAPNRYTLPPAAMHAVFSLTLEPLSYHTAVRGTVVDVNGRPVPDVTLNFKSGLAITTSDANGNFDVRLPVKAGTVLPVRATRNGHVGYHDVVTVSAEVPVKISFRAQTHE